MLKNSVNILRVLCVLLFPACGPGGDSSSDLENFLVPEVRIGDALLKKVLIHDSPRFVVTTDLLYGDLTANPGYELGVGGNDGIEILDANMKVINTTIGRQNLLFFELLDIDNDGTVECVGNNFSEWAFYSLEKRELWTTARISKYGNALAHGQLDGDSALEFVLIDSDGHRKKRSQLMVLDHAGAVMTSTTIATNLGMEPMCEIVDIDGDSINEIVVLTDEEGIFLFDNKLNLLRNFELPFKEPQFSVNAVIPFPTKDGKPHFLFYSKGSFIVATMDGIAVASFHVPPLTSFRATHVQLQADEEPYFVIFGEIILQGRRVFGLEVMKSELYVFDSKGTFIYDEIMGISGGAMTTMPSTIPGEEALLIGGGGKVYSLTYNHQALQKNEVNPTKALDSRQRGT